MDKDMPISSELLTYVLGKEFSAIVTLYECLLKEKLRVSSNDIDDDRLNNTRNSIKRTL